MQIYRALFSIYFAEIQPFTLLQKPYNCTLPASLRVLPRLQPSTSSLGERRRQGGRARPPTRQQAADYCICRTGVSIQIVMLFHCCKNFDSLHKMPCTPLYTPIYPSVTCLFLFLCLIFRTSHGAKKNRPDDFSFRRSDFVCFRYRKPGV